MPNFTREVSGFCYEHGAEIKPQPGERFVFISDYHGDHQCEWIKVERDGSEIERHNTRYIARIRWAKSEDAERAARVIAQGQEVAK